MTMMTHTDIAAPFHPKIRIKLDFFAEIVKNIVQAHRHSREAQNLLRTHDVILRDLGLTRLKANGNIYLFSHHD